MELKFPFSNTNIEHRMFGAISNYQELLDACPEEFRDSSNKYSDLAFKIYVLNTEPKEVLEGYAFSDKTDEEITLKYEFLRTWLASSQPKLEDKMAVSGWLLSLMLEPKEEEK